MKNLKQKNIIVLCDGTANQVTVNTSTNVIRMAERIDKTFINGSRQVLFYDPGLGTENAPGTLSLIGKSITKFLGLVFGYGLGKNLADAYAFLMQHYEPGDKIYIFGFSRGAYTARALTGLLGRIGLLEKGCNSLIPYVIKYYRESNGYQLNYFKERFSRTYELTWDELIQAPKPWNSSQRNYMDKASKGVIPVHFLGVWDTVNSIGLLGSKSKLLDTNWLPNMINGRHAVAIDEKRSQYQPVLWDSDTGDKTKHQLKEKEHKDEGNYQHTLHDDVETRWFPGAHADVGGGYGFSGEEKEEKDNEIKELKKSRTKAKKAKNQNEEDKLNAKIEALENLIKKETALAYYSLHWMTEAAKAHGLRIKMKKQDEEEEREFLELESPKLHNPLKPFWWILGSKDRKPEVNKRWTKESLC